MSSQKTKELNTNEIEKIGGKLLPFWEAWGMVVVASLIGVLAVGGGVLWWMQNAKNKAADAWAAVGQSSGAAQFGEVADKFKNSPAGQFARLAEAEAYLGDGLRLLFTDKKAAVEDLKKSRESFEKLIAANPSAAAHERALFGLATAQESLAGNAEELQVAIGTYEKLLATFEESIYKKAAEDRIANLKKPGYGEFYAWLGTQNPKPEDRRLPADNATPDTAPLAPPTIPDLLRTDTFSSPKPGENPFTTVPGAPTEPGTTPNNAPPFPELPAPAEPEKPAEEKKPEATPEKPAEPAEPEKPAEEKKEENS